jgi:hypothetical protein
MQGKQRLMRKVAMGAVTYPFRVFAQHTSASYNRWSLVDPTGVPKLTSAAEEIQAASPATLSVAACYDGTRTCQHVRTLRSFS